jgi:hypothetical protein
LGFVAYEISNDLPSLNCAWREFGDSLSEVVDVFGPPVVLCSGLFFFFLYLFLLCLVEFFFFELLAILDCGLLGDNSFESIL